MNFDDLKEQFIEKIEEFKDSEIYQTTSEKYQALAPNVQKLIVWMGILGFTCVMFSCFGPLGYHTESSEYVEIYEQKRDQIRKLLLAKQKENQTSNIPKQMTPDQFRSSILSTLSGARLLQEQQAGLNPFDVSKSSLRPKNSKNIQQEGLEVQLKQLNLTQIINLGYKLESINEAVKLAGVDISATADNDHYFDVNFRLIRFSLNTAPAPAADEKDPKGRRKKRGQ